MMDITGLARFSGGYAFTRTKNTETGKATGFDEECGKAAADTGEKKNPNVREIQLLYTISEENDGGSYTAKFYYGDITPSCMTWDERCGVPAVHIPANVVNRMGNDRVYADRIRSQIEWYVKSQGGELKDAKLPLDEEGNIIDQDAPDSLFVKGTGAKDDGKGIWMTHAERQDEYIKYSQHKEMEHRIALSMEFAAFCKSGRIF